MSFLDSPDTPSADDPGERRSRWPLIAGAGAIVLVLAAGVWYWTRPVPAPPAEEPPAEAAVRPRPPSTAARPAPPPEAPAALRSAPAAAPEPEPVAAAPAEPSAPARTLTVDTDVKGAMVFVDRVFLGYAPVTSSEVKPGSHQLNVSAAGYDGVAQTIDIAESGPTTVSVRLAEVRLNQTVEVVHKHRVGLCRGELVADLSGFTYKPQTGNDGFSVPLNAVEMFEIDYLEKNLRLKQRGGRTWNFESPTGSADPLFVFHRDVEKVRGKLTSQ